MIITNHAEDRLRERLGLNKKSVYRHVCKAYEKGLTINSVKGRLRKYLENQKEYNSTEKSIRLYGQYVYIFVENRLITVYKVPNTIKLD